MIEAMPSHVFEREEIAVVVEIADVVVVVAVLFPECLVLRAEAIVVITIKIKLAFLETLELPNLILLSLG